MITAEADFESNAFAFCPSERGQYPTSRTSYNVGPLIMVRITTDECLNLPSLYTQFGSYRETIESPYADGEAKIIQVVQNDATISVLYAWTPPERDLANRVENHEPTIKGSTKHILTMCDNSYRHGLHSAVRINQTPPSSGVRSVRYHLLHYNIVSVFF